MGLTGSLQWQPKLECIEKEHSGEYTLCPWSAPNLEEAILTMDGRFSEKDTPGPIIPDVQMAKHSRRKD